METQFQYVPKTSPQTQVRVVEESHPYVAGKVCWRAYTVEGRRLGWSDISREHVVTQVEKMGHKVVEDN
jgi:hypothetical protein